jgi:glutamine amidotransferase
MIGILDYGFGNLQSVANAIDALGLDPLLVCDPADFDTCTHLIIPGVGAFDAAMSELKSRQLIPSIHAFARSKRPLLGICLGMQVLADYGEEGCGAEGLGLIPGKVLRFPLDLGLNTPHCGWNTVQFVGESPLWAGLKSAVDFYFVHSYRFVPESLNSVRASTDYGETFTSIVGAGNVIGAQFHPEKSQGNGLRLLENFCHWDGSC